MADRFYVTAFGVEDEGAVIVRVVMRAHARRAIVLAAGRDRGGVKPVDRGAIRGGEGNMQRAFRGLSVADPEEGPDVAVTGEGRAAALFGAGADQAFYPQGRQRLLLDRMIREAE